jgi:tetratricopeptide (TPR) repeat protein
MSFTVQEVAQLLKQAKENEKPYVFFTGAGCSVKADVPSATDLIKEICEKFPIQIRNIDPEKDKYNYGKYMSALDKDERRRLLKPHIVDNKKINWAHIALACLMQNGYIQRVLTFNFDSIFSRACNMLGLHPSIYDFATANPHLYHLINDPSIIHLHGQGTGFVQLNTGEETEKHTKKLGEFIAATLNSNPSLFIGYSGNADAFFPLLEEKYSEQHRLIWTGTKTGIDDIESDSVKNFLKKNNNLTHYIGNTYADDFLIQLAKELDCFPPELFSNPYTFLNQQLSSVQPYPLGDGLDILETLSAYLKKRSKNSNLAESLYTAFIHKYQTKESTKELSEKEIDQIMWAYDKQARLLYDAKQFEKCFELYKQGLMIKMDHLGCNSNYAALLSEIAKSESDENLFKKAIEQYEIILKIQPDDIDVIGNYGVTLMAFAKLNNNQDIYDQAFKLLEKNIKVDPHNTYNLACYYSIKNDFELSKENLLHAEKHKTLPPNKYLSEDQDLENVRNESWFIELLERLKAKE